MFTPDGSFRTGDMGFMRRLCRYFKITDRKKDMIVVSGLRYFPMRSRDVASMHTEVLSQSCHDRRARIRIRRGGEDLRRAPESTAHRGGVARALQEVPYPVQGAEDHRAPRRSAPEVQHRQDSASTAQGAGALPSIRQPRPKGRTRSSRRSFARCAPSALSTTSRTRARRRTAIEWRGRRCLCRPWRSAPTRIRRAPHPLPSCP